MSDFLRQMAAASAARAEALAAFRAADFDKPLHPLVLDRFDLIAEIKERSPSEGTLAAKGEARALRARQYAEGGAAAVSVLTEPSRFGGALGHLEEVAAAVGVPVMRKDFLVDLRQVQEARAAGASGVLLIAAMVTDATLRAMLHCAFELSMFVLLECFDESDLERAAALLKDAAVAEQAAGRRLLVGINSRDLRTLRVDPDRLAALAPRLPKGAIAVAESGIDDAAAAAGVAASGYRAALVGTALMRARDPAALVRGMLQAGRERSP